VRDRVLSPSAAACLQLSQKCLRLSRPQHEARSSAARAGTSQLGEGSAGLEAQKSARFYWVYLYVERMRARVVAPQQKPDLRGGEIRVVDASETTSENRRAPTSQSPELSQPQPLGSVPTSHNCPRPRSAATSSTLHNGWDPWSLHSWIWRLETG
jgi:hypothetical protein